VSEHTPGPWLQVTHTAYALQQVGWRKGEPEMGNRFTAHVQGASGTTSEELAANARLIAAAPELLEAAKALAGLYHGLNQGRSFPTQAQCDQAISAIAKAEGRT
jgi:hypothetical protein